MHFRQLEFLQALAREHRFSRAADACYVSQPALSEAIRKLEEELDVPIVRRGRSYEGLTPEGERILVWAQRILADRDALTHELGALRTGLSGRLRVGTVPTASSAAALLTDPFCGEHPLVTVDVQANLRSDEILRKLQNFELDAGITYLNDESTQDLPSVPLYRERYALLTDAAEGAARRTTATWAEASQLPLCLLSSAMQGRRVLDAVFTELDLHPTARVETDSVAALLAHVRTGTWASIVPYAWLHLLGSWHGMRVVPLVEPAHSAPIGLVAAGRSPGSVMARALLETARRVDAATPMEGLPQDAVR